MMGMRARQPPPSASISGPSRYDRMAAPGHITKMNTKVNWAEFSEGREKAYGNHLPAISSGGDLNMNTSYRKRTPLSTADLAANDRFTILPDIEGIDLDKELCESLSAALVEVSRQRLRAIKIGFHRLAGSGSAGPGSGGGAGGARAAMRDVLAVLGEHNVRVGGRACQLILRKFGTQRGVDTDGLWKYMAEAQAKTGRDSIQAINQNKQASSSPPNLPLEPEDMALLASINKALKSSNEYDLEELRSVCQMRDISRHGLLPRKMFRRICLEQHVPLGASLMRTMLKRCDDKKNGLISWQEFLMLLEKGATFNEDKYQSKRRAAATAAAATTLYKQSVGHLRKPASPKSSPHLLPNGTAARPAKDGGGKAKPRPSSSDLPASRAARSKNSADGPGPKSANGQATSTLNGRLSEQKTRARSEERGAHKSPELPGQKGKAKDTKATWKSKEKVQQEEDTLSVKSLPSPRPRKSKAISWDSSASVAGRTVQSRASSEPDPSSTASERDEATEPPPPPPPFTPPLPPQPESIDSKPTEAVLSAADLDQRRDDAGHTAACDQITNAESAGKADPVEQEYLQQQQQQLQEQSQQSQQQLEQSQQSQQLLEQSQQSQQQLEQLQQSQQQLEQSQQSQQQLEQSQQSQQLLGQSQELQQRQESVSRTESEVTLMNEPSSDGSSLGPEQQSGSPAGEADQRASSSPADDVSEVIRLTPSVTGGLSCEGPEEPQREEPQADPSAAAAAEAEAQGRPDEPEGSETGSAWDKDEADAQSVASLPLPAKSKPRKVMSERRMRAAYGRNPKRPAATPDKKARDPRPTPGKPPKGKAPASRKAAETRPSKIKSLSPSGNVKKENTQMPASTGNEGVQDGDNKSLVSRTSIDSRESQGDEKNNGPAPEGALSLPDDDAKEGAGLPAVSRGEDGETAAFVIHGQEVSYYKPDAYTGKDLPAEAPTQTLEIDWIYGYRGNDCRCNMFVIEDGVLAYFIGKVAVLYDMENHRQRHYMQHTAEIKSLAVHSSNVILATGQTAGPENSGIRACLHVWSAETLETLYVAGEGYFQGAVACLSFCKEEDYLVAVDDSEEHTMSVWLSSSGERLAEKELLTEVVCQVAFHPIHPHQLVSIGKEHLCFWRILKDPYTIEETMIANWETKMKAKYIICLTFHPSGGLLTGDSNGTIYLWNTDGNTIAHTITHAHDGPVFWLMYVNNTLMSGGRDGIIQTYKLSPKETDFTGKLKIPSVEGGVRTIQIHNDRMYIGTTLNCILSASITMTATEPQITGATINNAPITQGHYDEVHCIAAHGSKKNHFFTAAYDGIVCLYDAAQHKAIWKYVVKGINATCMDVNPSGDVIILGAKDGHLVVLSVGEEEVLETNRIKLGRLSVSVIKFAPDGKLIATSCGNIILILQTSDSGQTIEPLGKCEGHLTPITGFDWSKEAISDRWLLQSSSLSHEYLCWDIATFKALDFSADYRNVAWSSHNCKSGFTVSGVWEPNEDGTEVTSVDWYQALSLLVAGTNEGLVNLYRYPCANQQPSCRSVFAHSKSTPCVRFLSEGSSGMVLSAGGPECTTIQWTIRA